MRDIKELQINHEIREREIRLIDVDGEQLGVMQVAEAIKIAEERRLDLVNVAPNAKPPVCRILDYGKYKYEMAKKERDAKRNQRTMTLKEVRMSPNIEEHDLGVKARQTIDFLKNGDKVKVSVRFRGREMGHTQLGREVLDNFLNMVEDHAAMEKGPAMEGRSMAMFLVPAKDEEDKSE